MKVKTKLVILFLLFLIPIILLWIYTNSINEQHVNRHSLEIAKYYSSTFSFNFGREKENLGTLAIMNNNKELENYVQDFRSIEGIYIVVVDMENTIIADVNESEIGDKYSHDSNGEIYRALHTGLNGNFKEIAENNPKGRLIYVHPITNERGRIVGAILLDYTQIWDRLQKEENKTEKATFYVGLLFILISIAFVFILSQKINKSVSKLVYAVRGFAQGDYSVRINSERKDELGEIEYAFNNMVEHKKKSDEKILLLGNAIRCANDMISIADMDAKFIFVNDSFCNGYGYKEDEVIGKHVSVIRSEQNINELSEILAPNIFVSGWHGEQWSKAKNGSEFIIDMNISPVKNNNGEVIGLVGITNDITKKKQSEEALRISEEKFRQVFNNIPIGIVYINSNGQVIHCNDIFLNILSITQEEFNRFNFSMLENNDFREAYELANSGVIGKYEGDYKSILSKKIISLKVSFAPIVTEDDKIFGVVGIFEDISERKQIERFFFHDILNTAGNLRGYCELLNDDSMENDDKTTFTSQLLLISNQLIGEIVSQRSILSSDKLKMELNISLINTLDFLNTICLNFKQTMISQNKRILIEESASFEIRTDRALLSRIIENLIKNAIEASNPGQTISLGINNENSRIIFWVHNKTFIPEEIQSKIFQRSFSTKGGGRGIGTYSIKFLTEAYLKGEVYFSSNNVTGTTFFIRIPSTISANVDNS